MEFSITEFVVPTYIFVFIGNDMFQLQIVCTLSDEQLPGAKGKIKRTVLPMSEGRGDGKEGILNIYPADTVGAKVDVL